VAPACLLLAALVLFPLGYTLWLSLHRWTVVNTTVFVGLQNFARLFTDERVLGSFAATAVFVGGSVALQLGLGVALALVLQRAFRGQGLARVAFLVPLMATPAAVAMVWSVMLDAELGIVNQMLRSVGLPRVVWLSTALAPLSMILVDTWQHTPFVMLVALGGLFSLPPEPFEAARIDGASRWQVFWHVTLPLLRPVLMVAVLFRTISALQAFDTIFVITGGGPEGVTEVVSLLAYAMAFDYNRFGDAAAVLVVLGLAILGLSALFLRVRRAAA
jgi:multiple sugar transport system permease protein